MKHSMLATTLVTVPMSNCNVHNTVSFF